MADEEQQETGLLVKDLAWERQQKKTFTAWCNSHLRKVGQSIEELDKAFHDGKVLHALLEVISGDTLPKIEKGKMRVHKVNNVQKALDFIASKGVRLIGVGAEEIVDGNLKMTLGMIWTIILRFAIQDISIEEMTAKEGLLLWCQRKTAPYKNVNVQNFHMSFKDGLAFCGLIARHRPDLIDMSKLRKDTPEENLRLAFETAEKELDIPKMLDPEDLIHVVKPDERAVMTYVSAYYHAFSSSQQAEQAASRIQKVLDITRENEAMMDDFEDNARALIKWIDDKINDLADRSSYTEMDNAKNSLDDFNNYRTVQKAEKAEEKAQLEVKLNTLQTKLRVSNRPAYEPAEGSSISDVNTKWKLLDSAETEREDFIYSEIKRLVRMELSAAKFYNKARIQDAWTEGKEASLGADDVSEASLAAVLAMTKQHEAFVSDFNAKQVRITQLTELAQELETLQYPQMDDINSRLSSIKATNSNIEQLADQRKQRLEEAEARLMHIDQLRLDWAKKASPFNNYLEFTAEELTDIFQVTSIEEVEALIAALEQTKSELASKQEEHDNLAAIITELQSLGVETSNPYTPLTPEQLEASYQELQTVHVPKREQQFTEELEKQRTRENIRVTFATKANEVGPWLEGESEKLASMAVSVTGSLEEHLKALKQEEETIINYKSNLDDLETAHQQVQEALIFKNPHTKLTMHGLRVQYQQLRNAAGHNINAVENQILTRDAMGVTEDQVQEFRQSFNHFDKDSSGQLDRNEFKACLLSLGFNLGDNQEAALDALLKNVAVVKQEEDGSEAMVVPFTNFLDFMIRQSTAEDTAEQVKSSFKVLAGDKPYVTADEIRLNMQPEMAEYCIARMEPYTADGAPEGALDYNKFANLLYTTTHALRPVSA